VHEHPVKLLDCSAFPLRAEGGLVHPAAPNAMAFISAVSLVRRLARYPQHLGSCILTACGYADACHICTALDGERASEIPPKVKGYGVITLGSVTTFHISFGCLKDILQAGVECIDMMEKIILLCGNHQFNTLCNVVLTIIGDYHFTSLSELQCYRLT
jgi:hypothetical protein